MTALDTITGIILCVTVSDVWWHHGIMVRLMVAQDSLLIITCQPPVSPSLLSSTFLQSAVCSPLPSPSPHTKYLAIFKKKKTGSWFTFYPPARLAAFYSSGRVWYWTDDLSDVTSREIWDNTTAWYHLLSYFTPPGSSFNVWECIFMRWSDPSTGAGGGWCPAPRCCLFRL